MATQEEIDEIIEEFHRNHTKRLMNQMQEMELGMMGVLKYLDENAGEICSKDISAYMQVSSARMAKMLQKMAQKGLLEKRISEKDNRVILITLTEQGRKTIEDVKTHMRESVASLIDEMGMDMLLTIIKGVQRIRTVMEYNTNSVLNF